MKKFNSHIFARFLQMLVTSNNKNLDTIYKKIEATSKKTEELKNMQGETYYLHKKLIENQNKLTSIINTATDAIIVLDINNNVVLWNKAAEKIFGYSLEEIQSLGIRSIMKYDDFTKHSKKIMNFKIEFLFNKNINMLSQIVQRFAMRKDGTIIPVEISYSSWRNNGDVYFTGIIRDLTEILKSREKIYTLETINTLIIKNEADGIIVFDKDLKYKIWNPTMEKITKVKAEEVLDKNVYDMFPGLKESEFKIIIPKVFEGNEVRASLSLYTDKEGEQKYIKGTYSPLYDFNKENIIGIIGDIRIVPVEDIKNPHLVQHMDSTGKILKK